MAQHAVTDGAVEVKQIGDAVRHVMASAPHEAATAATALPGGPLIRKAAATAVTRAVTAVVAANPAGSVTVHRDSASSPAVTAVLPSLPNLRGILGIPALALAIPVDAAEGVFCGADEATLGLGDVLFGLGTGDRGTVQFGINEIASAIPDGINEAVNRVTVDVQAIARALGFNTDAVDSAAVARVAKVADAKNHGAVAVAPKSLSQPTPHDATKPDATKGTHATKGTDSTKGDATADATKADATKGTDTTKPTPSPTPPRVTPRSPTPPSQLTPRRLALRSQAVIHRLLSTTLAPRRSRMRATRVPQRPARLRTMATPPGRHRIPAVRLPSTRWVPVRRRADAKGGK